MADAEADGAAMKPEDEHHEQNSEAGSGSGSRAGADSQAQPRPGSADGPFQAEQAAGAADELQAEPFTVASTAEDHVRSDELQDDLSALDAHQLQTLVRQMRVEHAAQIEAESRARAEVEDMCLRIEKHFKAEKVCLLAMAVPFRYLVC